MSSAEQMAEEFEKDGGPDNLGNAGGKRTKNERVEHKHHSDADGTRKIVSNAHNGEQKRKEANK